MVDTLQSPRDSSSITPPTGSPSASTSRPAECLVEFEHASGAKMRIQVMGGSLPDLAALSRLFLKQRA